MIVELGHFALVAAFIASLFQVLVPAAGAHYRWRGWMDAGTRSATVLFVLCLAAFTALTVAFVYSDFSVELVARNSHSAKPLLYKFTGVWGNHEGSLLLWVLILTLFGASIAWFGNALPPRLKARVLGVQGALTAAFLALILFTSNPFLRAQPAPFDGNDLNPLLQDPGLAFHPPFLYLGYVGLSISFSFAIAALMDGNVDAAWARRARPWTLASWTFLTIGIALGSWWAYYELGWGGWWFWDPVENASFMPWLIATALLHSSIVTEKRESLKSWTILLALLAFTFSMIGTFLVRSGIITSVHAFASDPARGVFILAILFGFSGGGFALYAYRAATLTPKGAFGLASRESALILNNALLVVAAFVVFVGTFWPLVAELVFGNVVSVGPPFFDMAFTPFVVLLAALLPIGALLPWKRGSIEQSFMRMRGVLVLALALGSLAWAMQTGSRMLAPIGIALASWIIAGALFDLVVSSGAWRRGFNPGRLVSAPGAQLGKAAAHAGFGILILGISAITAWEVEDIRMARPGESFQIGGYDVRFEGVETASGPNYRAVVGTFVVFRNSAHVASLTPERRYYPVAGMQTTEAAIDRSLFRDLYMVIGESDGSGGWTVRTYLKPLANWIWAGAMIMAFGGLLGLSDRRFRFSATAKAARRLSAETE